MSLQDKMVGAPGHWVGMANYAELFRDEVFLRTAWNSVVYTVVAVALKFVLGLTMALILDQERRFNNFFRALLFVPWAVPVVIVSLNWRWIFDDLSGFLNNFLITFHLSNSIISWLSDPALAMGCVIAVVVWAGTPLYSMTFLAGLQAIPGAVRGGRDRWSLRHPAVLLRDGAAPQDDLPHHRDAVDHLDRHESPVRVRAHAGRPSEPHRDLSASGLHDRAGGAATRHGRGGVAGVLSRPGRAHRTPDPPDAPAVGRLDALGEPDAACAEVDRATVALVACWSGRWCRSTG
jgi:hypothetical protein